MKTGLRVAALFIALTAVGLWFFGGMNLGWTKTSVPVNAKDPVTGIDYVEWQHHFLPGLEFLAGGLLLSAALSAASLFIRSPQTAPPAHDQPR